MAGTEKKLSKLFLFTNRISNIVCKEKFSIYSEYIHMTLAASACVLHVKIRHWNPKNYPYSWIFI